MEQPQYVYTIIIPKKVIQDNYNKIVERLLLNSLNLKFSREFVELLEEYPNPSLLPAKLPEDYPETFSIYSYNYNALLNFKNTFASFLKIIRFWGVSVS